MKFGICEWSLPWNGQFGTKFAHELGLDGIELDLGPYEFDLPLSKPEMQKAYLEAAQKYELEYPSMAVNTLNQINHLNQTRGTHERYLAVRALKKAVDACDAMKIPVIQVPNFYHSVLNDRDDIVRTALAFKEGCEYAYDKGITITSENALRGEDLQLMIETVGMDNFGVFFDSQNYWKHKGWDGPEVYDEIHEYCVDQIHIKDGYGHPVSSAMLGKGDSKFFEFAETVKKHNFDGWLILENYFDRVPLCLESHDTLELIRQDLATAKKAFAE